MNTNGSAIGNPGRVGASALIRDHDYIWVRGCYRFIPKANNTVVELWTLRNGLTLAMDLNLSYLETEVDATAIINFLSNLSNVNSLLASLIDDCRMLWTIIPNARVKHVFREDNRRVDALANLQMMQPQDSISNPYM